MRLLRLAVDATGAGEEVAAVVVEVVAGALTTDLGGEDGFVAFFSLATGLIYYMNEF